MEDKLTEEDMDNYRQIKDYSGKYFTGNFPDDSIRRLIEHGLVERSYQGMEGLMGLSRISAK